MKMASAERISQKKKQTAWEKIRGMWTRKPINGLAYQRKLREASDKRLTA